MTSRQETKIAYDDSSIEQALKEDSSFSKMSKKFISEVATASKNKEAAPFFVRGTPVVDVLFKSKAANMAADRDRSEKPIEVYSDLDGRPILSTDPRFIMYKDDFSKKATDQFPENVDDLGRVYGNGVRSNFYGMRHVNGFPMKNATWPLADNSKKREDLNLASAPVKDWHEKIFRAFVELVFSDLEAVPLKWRRGSSTTGDEFTTSDVRKTAIAREAFRTAEKGGKLIKQGEQDQAYLLYKMGGCLYVVYRAQSTDKITLAKDGTWEFKKRFVSDFTYAVTGGKAGKQFESSKDASEIIKTAGFARERLRTATAFPGPLGYALMPIMQAARKKMFERFPFSFHHTSRMQKQRKMQDWNFAIMTDVSDHDINYPSWIFHIWEDVLRNLGYAEWWIELFSISFKLPVYVSSPAEGEGHVLIGDWRKPDLKIGLGSGHPGTDLLGTGFMSMTYAIMQIEHTAPDIEKFLSKATQGVVTQWVSSYLKGKESFGAMSKSDDAATVWKPKHDEAVQSLYKKLYNEEQVSPYMVIGLEHGGAFLGDILLYDSTRELRNARFVGNILSMLNNSDSPEYGIESEKRDRSRAKRPYPGIAWGSTFEVYGSCPIYTEISALREECWKNAFGFSYRAMRIRSFDLDERALAYDLNKMAAVQSGDRKKASDLSPIELDVLAHPEKIHYKYDESDVRPEILKLIMTGLPIEEVTPYFNSIVGKSTTTEVNHG